MCAHISLASGHPGTQQTLELIQGKNWWPTMANDVNRYESSCSTSPLSHWQTNAITLQQLWSPIAVDV